MEKNKQISISFEVVRLTKEEQKKIKEEYRVRENKKNGNKH